MVKSVTMVRLALCGVHGRPASAASFATRSVRTMPPM